MDRLACGRHNNLWNGTKDGHHLGCAGVCWSQETVVWFKEGSRICMECMPWKCPSLNKGMLGYRSHG